MPETPDIPLSSGDTNKVQTEIPLENFVRPSGKKRGKHFGRDMQQPASASTSTRREFVANAAKLGALAGAMAFGFNKLIRPKAPPQVTSPTLTNTTPNPTEQQIGPQVPEYLQKLYPILKISPFLEDGHTQNKARVDLEKDYVTELMKRQRDDIKLVEIDDGLSIIANEEQRIKLMNLRFNLRQGGYFVKEGVTPLDQAHIDWANNNGIKPTEMLGIIMNNEMRAKDILQKLLASGTLRDELNTQPHADITKLDVTQFMINPGGLAGLFQQETRGFTFIGSYQALSQLDGGYFSERTNALPQLCKLLEDTKGFPYEAPNIPGSGKGGPGNESGGAIGAQFMPGNALSLLNYVHTYTDIWLNPFNPGDAAVMAWVFLARQEKVGPGPTDYRIGYKRGDIDAIKYSLYKWNHLPSEEQAIYKDATSYFQKFLQSVSDVRKSRSDNVVNLGNTYHTHFQSIAA